VFYLKDFAPMFFAIDVVLYDKLIPFPEALRDPFDGRSVLCGECFHQAEPPYSGNTTDVEVPEVAQLVVIRQSAQFRVVCHNDLSVCARDH
jgi:hypothetical protein